MKKTGSPSVSQMTLKHEAILDAARKVFLKQGFQAASMDEIARQANVSKKTVYGHFAHKKELFELMLNEHWNLAIAWRISVRTYSDRFLHHHF